MSQDLKSLITKGFEEGMNNRNFDLFDELLQKDFINHSFPGIPPGPEGFKGVLRMFLNAFPDMKIKIEDIISNQTSVVTRGHWTGTHKGEFMGIPATGKSVNVNYIDIWQSDGSKFSNNWVQMDIAGLMKQLGVLPS